MVVKVLTTQVVSQQHHLLKAQEMLLTCAILCVLWESVIPGRMQTKQNAQSVWHVRNTMVSKSLMAQTTVHLSWLQWLGIHARLMHATQMQNLCSVPG